MYFHLTAILLLHSIHLKFLDGLLFLTTRPSLTAGALIGRCTADSADDLTKIRDLSTRR